MLVQIVYNGLANNLHTTIDATASATLIEKSPHETYEQLEQMATTTSVHLNTLWQGKE